jgi:hypothetical protein
LDVSQKPNIRDLRQALLRDLWKVLGTHVLRHG